MSHLQQTTDKISFHVSREDFEMYYLNIMCSGQVLEKYRDVIIRIMSIVEEKGYYHRFKLRLAKNDFKILFNTRENAEQACNLLEAYFAHYQNVWEVDT